MALPPRLSEQLARSAVDRQHVLVVHTPHLTRWTLVADVKILPPKGFNSSVYLDINHFSQQTAWAHGFMHAYALWLGPVLLAAVFVAAYAVVWWRRAPRAAALVALGGIGTLAALGLNQIIGHAAKESRPYVTYPNALVLVGKTNDYSFPSDHAVLAGGLTISLLLVLGWALRDMRRGAGTHHPGHTFKSPGSPAIVVVLSAVNVVLGLGLCFARVYVGAHYPGDVVAGYLLASVVVVAVSLLRPLAYRLVEIVLPTPLGLVLRRPLPGSTD